jgi:hypothetical protein
VLFDRAFDGFAHTCAAQLTSRTPKRTGSQIAGQYYFRDNEEATAKKGLLLKLRVKPRATNDCSEAVLAQVRHGMVEKTPKPCRISSGNSWIYTPFAIEPETLS